MKINRTITTTKILTTGSIACAVLFTALACSDDEADAPAGGSPDSGAQGGGGNGNDDAGGSSGTGGTAGTSSADAGDAGEVCVIDTAAAVDGCDGETIDIAGEYDDGFGPVSIGSCSLYGAAVTELSNAEQYFITQNACDVFFPGKWSRYDWTWFAADGGAPQLYFCNSTYDAESEADAIAAPRADDTDPAHGGCGGADFPWSLLTPVATSDAGADSGTGVGPGDAGSDAATDAGDGG